jgi:hypothetical protein
MVMKTDKGKGKRHINVRIDKAGDERQSFVSQTSSFSLTGVTGQSQYAKNLGVRTH